MKHLLALLTLALVGFAGCVTMPAAVPVTHATRKDAPPAAPVRAEQVTPQSAQKMSQALADELDRDAQQEITATAQPKREAAVR